MYCEARWLRAPVRVLRALAIVVFLNQNSEASTAVGNYIDQVYQRLRAVHCSLVLENITDTISFQNNLNVFKPQIEYNVEL